MTDITMNAICDLFHIGAEARTESVLIANIENVIRRASCLLEVERQFFTSTVEDDGAEIEDCMLNWGDAPDEYAVRFGQALQVIAAPSSAARDVLAERRRQMEAEGWTPEHDDAHSSGELADAAACYALNAAIPMRNLRPIHWPWAAIWWKPTTPRRDLVKAAALILAEIERLDRSESKKQGANHGD